MEEVRMRPMFLAAAAVSLIACTVEVARYLDDDAERRIA